MLRPVSPSPVDILIIGAGWTAQFLLPLLHRLQIAHAATTTTGRDGTIPFRFCPSDEALEPYQQLPSARTVLVTFPLTGTGQSKQITKLYRKIHGDENRWIQLGSTGIFDVNKGWADRNSHYDKANRRAVAEDELIARVDGCVLNLSGLYGGQRDPRHWMGRIFKSKEDVRKKGAVHLVHGQDVARAIVGCHQHWDNVAKQRWIVTDLRVYDWWDLGMSWGGEIIERMAMAGDGFTDGQEELYHRGQVARWVGECMLEEGVRALPRDAGMVGKRLDAREFWQAIEAWPSIGRVG